MTKAQMIQSLEDAKRSHQVQMIKIEQILEGRDVESPTPVSKLECSFGMNFYPNEKQMINTLGAQLFERIDKFHEAWHLEYAKIHDIFFGKKKGFLSKIMGKKIDPLELDKAEVYFKNLEDLTQEVLHSLDVAIRRVGALSDEKFN